MKKHTVVISCLALAALAAGPVRAADKANPLSVRVRALEIIPADKSDAIPSLSVPADDITVSKKLIPEVDLRYAFNPMLSAELVLTYPQQHDVMLGGDKIGTFKHLPPCLMLQANFLPDAKVHPYIGAGVNLTLISSVDIAVEGVGTLDLESSSIGPAFQVGCDIPVSPKAFINLDAKYVQIRSDVLLGTTKVSAVKVDPFLVGGGIGFHF